MGVFTQQHSFGEVPMINRYRRQDSKGPLRGTPVNDSRRVEPVIRPPSGIACNEDYGSTHHVVCTGELEFTTPGFAPPVAVGRPYQ